MKVREPSRDRWRSGGGHVMRLDRLLWDWQNPDVHLECIIQWIIIYWELGHSQQTQDVDAMVLWCWPIVFDADPTLPRHLFTVLCLLCLCLAKLCRSKLVACISSLELMLYFYSVRLTIKLFSYLFKTRYIIVCVMILIYGVSVVYFSRPPYSLTARGK